MKAGPVRNLSQKLKQIPQRNGAYGLAQPDIFVPPKTTSPGVALHPMS